MSARGRLQSRLSKRQTDSSPKASESSQWPSRCRAGPLLQSVAELANQSTNDLRMLIRAASPRIHVTAVVFAAELGGALGLEVLLGSQLRLRLGGHASMLAPQFEAGTVSLFDSGHGTVGEAQRAEFLAVLAIAIDFDQVAVIEHGDLGGGGAQPEQVRARQTV
jgi:hypothetical protein